MNTYSVLMRKNADQKNSEYEHFSRIVRVRNFLNLSSFHLVKVSKSQVRSSVIFSLFSVFLYAFVLHVSPIIYAILCFLNFDFTSSDRFPSSKGPINAIVDCLYISLLSINILVKQVVSHLSF